MIPKCPPAWRHSCERKMIQGQHPRRIEWAVPLAAKAGVTLECQCTL